MNMRSLLLASALLASPATAQVVFSGGTPIVPPTAAFESQVGTAVDLDGDRFIAGAPAVDGGTAFVYARSGGNWQFEAELTAAGLFSTALFGSAVAIDGDVAVVGAFLQSEHGAAYVFERTGTTWSEVAALTVVDTIPGDWLGDRFGFSVAVDGDLAVVGARSGDSADGLEENVGSAYVFERGPTGWTFVDALYAPVQKVLHGFGHAVDIDGDTIVVTEPGTSSDDIGEVHVFREVGGSWTHEATMTADVPNVLLSTLPESFGQSVSIKGDQLVVGAPYQWLGGGGYVFQRQGTAWSESTTLISSLCGDNCGFGGAGASVAVDGDRVVLGEFSAGTLSMWYRDDAGDWSERRSYEVDDSPLEWSLGDSIALDGTTIIAGAPYYGPSFPERTGAVFVFELPVADDFFGESYCHGDYLNGQCDCGFQTGFVNGPGCQTNSAWGWGRGGLVIGYGSESVSAGDFGISGFGLPPQAWGVLIWGDNGAGNGTPFGNGLLCVEGNIRRSETKVSDASGFVDWAPGSPEFATLTPGEDRYFQVWFRDQVFCGHGFNLTNGFGVDFAP